MKTLIVTVFLIFSIGCDDTTSLKPKPPVVPEELKPFITGTVSKTTSGEFEIKTLSSGELVLEQTQKSQELRQYDVYLFEDREASLVVSSGGYNGGLILPTRSLSFDTKWSFKNGRLTLKDVGALDIAASGVTLSLLEESEAYSLYSDGPTKAIELKMQTIEVSEGVKR